MGVVRHWNKFPRGIVTVPALETLKTRWDGVLRNLFQWKVSLPMAGVELGTLFQPKPFCDYDKFLAYLFSRNSILSAPAAQLMKPNPSGFWQQRNCGKGFGSYCVSDLLQTVITTLLPSSERFQHQPEFATRRALFLLLAQAWSPFHPGNSWFGLPWAAFLIGDPCQHSAALQTLSSNGTETKYKMKYFSVGLCLSNLRATQKHVDGVLKVKR